jgi:hypothetical protein
LPAASADAALAERLTAARAEAGRVGEYQWRGVDPDDLARLERDRQSSLRATHGVDDDLAAKMTSDAARQAEPQRAPHSAPSGSVAGAGAAKDRAEADRRNLPPPLTEPDRDPAFTPWLLWRLLRGEPTAFAEASNSPAAAIYGLALTLLTGAGLFFAVHRTLADIALGAMTAIALLLVLSIPFASAGYLFGAPPRAYFGFLIVLATATPLVWPSLVPWPSLLPPVSGAALRVFCGAAAVLGLSRLIFHAARHQMRLHDPGAAMTVLLPLVTASLFGAMFAHGTLGDEGMSDFQLRLLSLSWQGTVLITLLVFLWFAALWLRYPGWSFSRGTVVWRRGGVRVLDKARRLPRPGGEQRVPRKPAVPDHDDD